MPSNETKSYFFAKLVRSYKQKCHNCICFVRQILISPQAMLVIIHTMFGQNLKLWVDSRWFLGCSVWLSGCRVVARIFCVGAYRGW